MNKLLLLISFVSISAGTLAQSIIRGPYLMVGTPTSMVVRWRTDLPTTTRVQFGTAAGALTQNVTDNSPVTEHVVKITGLTPKTRYFYSIGSVSGTLQGDAGNYFETSPLVGQPGKYRFGVYGDCGTNSAIQAKTRDQMLKYLGDNYLNTWLLLGDNAYGFGTDTEYQSNFFNHYKDSFMKRTPLYPSPGNHDYNNDNFDRQNDHKVPYYDVFSMPTQGEAGGKASETQAFYSYDYGNVHFLSLDSYGREDQATRLYDTLGRQVQWIKADLAANQNKEWVIAYWHHAPFSQGSRNSETDPEMTAIRENFIRILERYGVDLIICGHSHIYERSRLMGGFYQPHNAFNPSKYNYSSSSARYDGTDNSCPYIKSTDNNKGTVYVVSGSAGHLGGRAAEYPHKAMYYSQYEKGGAFLLEVEGNRLDAKWVSEDGEILDKFTMEKNVNKNQNLNLEYGSSVTLTPSFIGKYSWNSGETTKNITVSPKITTEYKVRDEFNCITDAFKINVSTPSTAKISSFTGVATLANVVDLKWTTDYEVKSANFIVERALDGKDFQEVGRVAGAGNSDVAKSYNWTDPSSNSLFNQQTLHYRLKITDTGGGSTYSQIIRVDIQLSKLTSKFSSFTGTADVGNNVTLKWTTEFENNSSHFIIESSIARSGFKPVGNVPAAKNAAQPKSYEWMDQTSSNVVNRDSLFYRLKLLDLAGDSTFSNVLAIKVQMVSKAVDIEIMPNPSMANAVQLRLTGKTSAACKLILTDPSGKTISTRQSTLTNQAVPFLPENAAPGLYFLEVVIGETRIVKKVVVY
ncbi:metallophosphoesterase [Dyadobacter sp. 32]|uniref:metallophosphoesterase n=1 Tax=Dyadobacter sp. 32 TaxID=538966 RepID=UPI0011F0384B